MIPSIPNPLAALARVGLLAAAVLVASAPAARSVGARDDGTPAPVDPLVHSQTSDRYVNGKYDKTGTYIPPHYQPVAKPRFRGYFFNKEESGDKTPNQADKPN